MAQAQSLQRLEEHARHARRPGAARDRTCRRSFEWAVWNAVARPDNAACRAVGHAGACWGVVAEKYRLILFGRYPYEEQWRPLIATALMIALLAASCYRPFWKRWLIALWIAVLAAFFVLMFGRRLRSHVRGDGPLGRVSADDHAVDDRAGDRVSAVDRGRARAALAHAGHPHAVRALRRADPRRAADLGPVHGVVHVSAVHAGGHDDRRAAARAGGDHAVFRRLSRRGRARRPAGAAARAGRGRRVARPRRTGRRRARSCCRSRCGSSCRRS